MSYIKSFVNQPGLSHASPSSLRKLTDSADEIIRGIKSLGPESTGRDPWLIFLMINKCDNETKQAWAEESGEKDLPSFEDFLRFLDKRCDALDTMDTSSRRSTQPNQPKTIRSHHVEARQ